MMVYQPRHNWKSLRPGAKSARERKRRPGGSMAKTNNTTPINVAGVKFHDIKEISVNEYCILPDAKGKAEQVHLWIEIEGLSHPLIMRFKSRPSLDKLVVDLIAAANNVWGSKGPSGYGCHNCGAMAEAK